MARTYVYVEKGNKDVMPGASSFTIGDFHGLKRNSANRVGNIHIIDAKLPILVQMILGWAKSKYGNVSIHITSTYRTPEFNRQISSSGEKGTHTLGIALDFIFSGASARNAWCGFKDEVIEKGPFFSQLISAGLGGIGVYGKGKYSFFFHIDTRSDGDSYTRGQELDGKFYGFWKQGDTDCPDKVPTVEEHTREISKMQPKVEEFIRYVHPNEGGDISVSELLDLKTFIGNGISKDDFLKVDKDKKPNKKRLWENLDIERKRELNSDNDAYSDSIDYPVTPGCILYIPLSKIDIDSNYESNFVVVKTSGGQFFPNILKQMTRDPGYRPSENGRKEEAKKIAPQAKVIVWSRTRFLEGQSGYIDVTLDIISIDISNSIEGGGDFSIEFSAIGTLLEEDHGTQISRPVKPPYIGSVMRGSVSKKSNFKQGKEELSEFTRVMPYYQRILSKNDMVFIAFEKLDLDGEPEEIGQCEVEGKMYDLIGMIDHVEVNSSDKTEIRVVCRGRSLMGVLMDDNSYFNSTSIGHQASMFGGELFSNGRTIDGQFIELSSLLARTIKENIQFIFHRIATIGYVPDSIFERFENRTITSKYTRNTEEGKVEVEEEIKGIWQIMRLFVDSNIRELRVADSSISNPQGTMFDLIRKVCQDPFVEFFTDTYGDRFYLIARKPPFEQDSLVKAIYQIGEDSDEEESQEDGTNKYLEYISEDESGELFYGGSLDETYIKTASYPKIVNIGEDDVISDSLKLSSEGYAWFELIEQGNFLGAKMGIGMIPLIYFDKLAQVFGNKKYTTTTNYTTLNFYLDKNMDDNRNVYAEQVAQQLGFLLETKLHLPFTREGSMEIDPDRRIKVGNYIYYRPTREIFYVTEVSNSIYKTLTSKDRVTSIRVSRGMVIDYIEGKIVPMMVDGTVKDIEVSYFNLINLQKIKETVYDLIAKETVEGKFDYKANVEIDDNVLNFFLQKRQFDEH